MFFSAFAHKKKSKELSCVFKIIIENEMPELVLCVAEDTKLSPLTYPHIYLIIFN